MSSTLDQWTTTMYEELETTTRQTSEGTYYVTFSVDEDAGPPEDDCYTPETIKAWYDNRWHYYTAWVRYVHYDGRVGYASLGHIDAGEYFDSDKFPPQRSVYEQLMELVLWNELDDEAYADLPERVFEVPVVAGKSFVVTFDGEGVGSVTEAGERP